MTTAAPPHIDVRGASVNSSKELPEVLWNYYAARETELKKATAAVAQHEKDEAKHQEAAFQKEAAAEADELVSESRAHGAIPTSSHIVDAETVAYCRSWPTR